MPSRNIDFLLTRYLDGTLSPHDRRAVQWLLNNNPAAMAQMNAYSKLDRLLAAVKPLPSIDWGSLTRRISTAIPRAI